jgi:hypothetical protein
MELFQTYKKIRWGSVLSSVLFNNILQEIIWIVTEGKQEIPKMRLYETTNLN